MYVMYLNSEIVLYLKTSEHECVWYVFVFCCVKQYNSFVTIFESFVSSLTSHLATAQQGCVLHHILTVVGEGRRATTSL